LRRVLFPLLLLLAAHYVQRSAFGDPEPPEDPWYASHAFIGYGGCLAVERGKALAVGDSVLVFDQGTPSRMYAVHFVVSADSARKIFEQHTLDDIYDDKALWNRIGGYGALRTADDLVAVARFRNTGDEEGLPLAIRGLPASGVWVGADASEPSAATLQTLARRDLSNLPVEFRGETILWAGRRFGRDLVELYLGKPFYSIHPTEAPIDSIHICQAFFKNGKMLGFTTYSRVSGGMERAETEPPELDKANWWKDMDETIGFLSLDGGRTWDRLGSSPGFEGIDWTAQRLTVGLPLLWIEYLYLSH
jgi:hypothetical protein